MAVKKSNTTSNVSREGWLLLSVAALILLFLFFKLFHALGPQLERGEAALREGRAIKLEGVVDKTVLEKIIADGNYYTDKRDIDLLADSLYGKLLNGSKPDNLGLLNKSAFAFTAPLAWQPAIGGADFQDRLIASRQRLGFDSALYVQELNNPQQHPSTLQVASGDIAMTGRVLLNDKPMPGVLVQLRQHVAAEDDSVAALVVYARTNDKGAFTFTGLLRDSGYSILPLKPGFEFGNRRGTSRLNKNTSYVFAAKPHKIRLIGTIV